MRLQDLRQLPDSVRIAALEDDSEFLSFKDARQDARLDLFEDRLLRMERRANEGAVGYHPELGLCTRDTGERLAVMTERQAILEGELQRLQAELAALAAVQVQGSGSGGEGPKDRSSLNLNPEPEPGAQRP
jgi:hypothetical protein